jgi:hypothetical protein
VCGDWVDGVVFISDRLLTNNFGENQCGAKSPFQWLY